MYERLFFKCSYSWINLEPQWSYDNSMCRCSGQWLLQLLLHFLYIFLFFTSMPLFPEARFTYDRNAPIDIKKGYVGFGLSAADCEGISTSGICWATSQMCGTKHHWKHYECHRKPTVFESGAQRTTAQHQQNQGADCWFKYKVGNDPHCCLHQWSRWRVGDSLELPSQRTNHGHQTPPPWVKEHSKGSTSYRNVGRINSRARFWSISAEEQQKTADLNQQNITGTIYRASVTSVKWDVCTEPKDTKRQHPHAVCSPCCHHKYLLLFHQNTELLHSSDCNTPVS